MNAKATGLDALSCCTDCSWILVQVCNVAANWLWAKFHWSLLLCRMSATCLVFFVSAVFHELVLGVPLHMVRLWAFCGIMFQVCLEDEIEINELQTLGVFGVRCLTFDQCPSTALGLHSWFWKPPESQNQWWVWRVKWNNSDCLGFRVDVRGAVVWYWVKVYDVTGPVYAWLNMHPTQLWGSKIWNSDRETLLLWYTIQSSSPLTEMNGLMFIGVPWTLASPTFWTTAIAELIDSGA